MAIVRGVFFLSLIFSKYLCIDYHHNLMVALFEWTYVLYSKYPERIMWLRKILLFQLYGTRVGYATI